MPSRFRLLTQTPAVHDAQRALLGRSQPDPGVGADLPEPLGEDERAFIAARDSFYLASVSETGWPYVQHRGGPTGFLRVLGPHRIAFADYPGNRQMISAGNVRADGRVALILVNYPARERMKILGRAQWLSVRDDPELVGSLPVPEGREAMGAVVIEVEAYDWNCPQHITPRFTELEIAYAARPLHERILNLEAEIARLRSSSG
jgi:hypothetical protein